MKNGSGLRLAWQVQVLVAALGNVANSGPGGRGGWSGCQKGLNSDGFDQEKSMGVGTVCSLLAPPIN